MCLVNKNAAARCTRRIKKERGNKVPRSNKELCFDCDEAAQARA